MAILAGAALVGGLGKSVGGLLGSAERAKGLRGYGRDTLLTARSNINQRKLNSQQTGFEILEKGQNTASRIQTQGMKAEASAKASAAGSGAVVDGGTPKAVLDNIAQESLHAQAETILSAKKTMKHLERETTKQNQAEWKGASAEAEKANKEAKDTLNAGRLKFVTDIAETAINTYTAGGSEWFKGKETAQALTKGQQASSVGMGSNPRTNMYTSKTTNKRLSRLKNLPTGQNAYSKSLSGARANKIKGLGSGQNVYSKNVSGWEKNRANFNWASNPGSKRVQGTTTNRGILRQGSARNFKSSPRDNIYKGGEKFQRHMNIRGAVDNAYKGKGFQSNFQKYGKWGFGKGKGRWHQVNKIAKKWKSGKLKRRK